MQALHPGLNANISPGPARKIFPFAWMKFMPPGRHELLAFWPECKKYDRGCRGAKSAPIVSAESARHMSARIARDSY